MNNFFIISIFIGVNLSCFYFSRLKLNVLVFFCCFLYFGFILQQYGGSHYVLRSKYSRTNLALKLLGGDMNYEKDIEKCVERVNTEKLFEKYIDPYSGENFKKGFKNGKSIIYSVGPDAKDDGGRALKSDKVYFYMSPYINKGFILRILRKYKYTDQYFSGDIVTIVCDQKKKNGNNQGHTQIKPKDRSMARALQHHSRLTAFSITNN